MSTPGGATPGASASSGTPSNSKKMVTLAPNLLELNLAESTTPHTTLTITNTSDTSLAFKIKTTTPKRYIVKPNQEVLAPRASVDVTITLKSQEAEQLLAMPAEEPKPVDRFMVSAVVVDDGFVKEMGALRGDPSTTAKNAFNNQFATLWDSRDKAQFISEKTSCRFVTTKASSSLGRAASTASSPPTAKEASASNLPVATAAPVSLSRGGSTATPSASSSAPPLAIPVASSASSGNMNANANANAATAAAAAAVASAAVAQRSGADAAMNGSSGPVDGAQYKALLNLVVQVTEERDRYQAAYREASKELAMRSMRPMGDGAASTSVAASGRGGYHLWHLLLVAVVSLLVSRLLMARELFSHPAG